MELTQIIARALREPELRHQLLAEPKKTLSEMNVAIPEEQNVAVLESSSHQAFFVIPLMTPADVEQLQQSVDSVHPNRSIRARVLIKAFQDADYRSRLLQNPKDVLIAEGMPLPEAINLTALENSLQQLYIVLPNLHH